MSLCCQEFVEEVTEYLEDALPGARRREVEEHLDDCDGCVAYLQQMRLAIRLVADPPPDPPDPEVRRRLVAAFAARSSRRG